MSFCYSLSKVLLGALVFVLISTDVLSAQTGTLKGRVTDKTTGEDLPGANIIIEGSTLGAATDLDGGYSIYNIPSGTQRVKVSYLGYEPQTHEVNIPERKTLQMNFQLSATTLLGKEIVITAQAQGQLEAINQQLSSDKIANIVSESRIQELPDFNAAQTIGRLPGVSTLQSSGEANKIVIRGLAPQFNSVEIEGFKLATTGSTSIGVISQGSSTDPSKSITNDRSVDISMISPYMLKTVAVYKSLTPDLNGNSIGGTVNMELREAPSEWHTDLLWQSGYTAKSKEYGNYRAVGSVSTRFFDDLLGVYLLGNIESYDRNADNMEGRYNVPLLNVGVNGFRDIRATYVEQVRHFETRKRYGGNLILDFKLPSGSIKSINMFTRLNSKFEDFRQFLNYFEGRINFNYKTGENDIDAAINTLVFNYNYEGIEFDLRFANTYAFNSLPNSPYLQFFQDAGITVPVPFNTIPEQLTSYQRYEASGGHSGTYLSTANLFSTRYKENNQVYKTNIKIPLPLGPTISAYLKTGVQYGYQNHSNDQETPYANLNSTGSYNQFIMDSLAARYGLQLVNGRFPVTNFTASDNELYNNFLDDKFGRLYWMADPSIPVDMTYFISRTAEFSGIGGGQNPGGWFNGPFQSLANDYKYKEKYFAGYWMTEVNIWRFGIVGGIRYENVRTNYEVYNMVDARNPLAQTIDTVISTPDNEFWLPMVQIKFKPLEWVDVRYAYTNTLARPDYHQLSPRIAMDYTLNSVWAGNPDLLTAKSFNHDLIFSFHNNEIGLITVGGFCKTIKNFSYYTTYSLHTTAPAGINTIYDYEINGAIPKDAAKVYTFINSPYEATVKGIEFDLQTRLWYLPFPLDGVVLGLNYTHISSEATYPLRNDRSRPNPNWYPGSTEPRVIVEVFDSTRAGRLIYQPDDILNSYIGYDYGGFSARVSFVFQGNSVSYIGGFPEEDGFTRDYFRMDASARQILPWANIEVYLDMFNLNNRRNASAQQTIGGLTNEQYYGFTANVGLRYRL
ncbi:MAG: carboxypeptidase-like regulatory domain-containing protein [Ignavibacteriales bacterium]|nr:MAG: carboxypeptidase-like regulatory domain-containing protein [Ignavibacteriales bacterium]